MNHHNPSQVVPIMTHGKQKNVTILNFSTEDSLKNSCPLYSAFCDRIPEWFGWIEGAFKDHLLCPTLLWWEGTPSTRLGYTKLHSTWNVSRDWNIYHFSWQSAPSLLLSTAMVHYIALLYYIVYVLLIQLFRDCDIKCNLNDPCLKAPTKKLQLFI